MIKKTFPTRPLGNTSVPVSVLGFGGALLGNLYQPVSDDTADEAMRYATEVGINYFDTAPFYGFGLSERRLGDFLREFDPDSYVLSTKVGRLLQPMGYIEAAKVSPGTARHGFHSAMPFNPVFDYSYDGVMRSFESSMQRLGLNHVDCLLMHDIGQLTHGEQNESIFRQAMDEAYVALDELRSAGVISAIGLGVNEYQVCEQAMEYGSFDCFLLAGRYTLLEQMALDSFFPKCARHGATVVIGGVYNSGILATGTNTSMQPTYNYQPAPAHIVEKVKKIEEICDAYAVPLPAAALQFPLAHPSVCSVIPGLESRKRVQQTLYLYRYQIPDDFWRALIAEQLLHADAPLPIGFVADEVI